MNSKIDACGRSQAKDRIVRYINLIILTIMLSVTWTWVQKDQNISELVHAEIQEDLQQLIASYIKKQLPNSENIDFKNIWTETLGEGKVKAHFNYSFDDSASEAGNAGVAVKGYAVLHRKPVSAQGTDVWTLDKIQILNNHVTFKEGLTFTKDSLNEQDLPEGDVTPVDEN